MKKSTSMLIGAVIAAFAATSAQAVQCTTDSYTITAAAPAGQNPVPLNTTIEATKCFGTFQMTPGSNPASLQPDSGNLGYLNDGLLNGEGGLVPWSTFINENQLQDLNPAPGTGRVDPGWIQLATMDGTGKVTTSSIGTGANALNLNQVLKFSETTDITGKIIAGTWSLALDAGIINTFKANGYFQNNNFDQLAFVVKASNNWAVYDFDFTKLTGFDLTKPYSLSGTWNLDDFKNKNGNDQALSFLGVWARDPETAKTNVVPEPGMLALFGAGLLSLAGLRRRRQGK